VAQVSARVLGPAPLVLPAVGAAPPATPAVEVAGVAPV
jgi:hypothetical protein